MSPPSRAAWHRDPFGRYELRYWDGATWTSHVSTQGWQGDDPPVAAPVVVAPAQPPAGWFPDPYGRHDQRYWDGTRWTDHIASRETQPVSPPPPVLPPDAPPAPVLPAPPAAKPSRKVARQARDAGASMGGDAGGGTVFTELVLIINQKAKLLGTSLEYAVYDQHGRQLGAFQQVRRDVATALSDTFSPFSQARGGRYRLVDMNHTTLLSMTWPVSWRKSSMVIDGPDGSPIGRIVRAYTGPRAAGPAATSTDTSAATTGSRGSSALSAVTSRLSSAWDVAKNISHTWFSLEAGGVRLGSIYAEDYLSWDFQILDANGAEIARITKTWAGWAKERFTKADHYVLRMHRQLEDPLLSLLIATAFVVDVELKQGEQYHHSSYKRRRYE